MNAFDDRFFVKVAVFTTKELNIGDDGCLWRHPGRSLVSVQSLKLLSILHDLKGDAIDINYWVARSRHSRIAWCAVASDVLVQPTALLLFSVLQPREARLLHSFGAISGLLWIDRRVDELHMAIRLDDPCWVLWSGSAARVATCVVVAVCACVVEDKSTISVNGTASSASTSTVCASATIATACWSPALVVSVVLETLNEGSMSMVLTMRRRVWCSWRSWRIRIYSLSVLMAIDLA